MLASTVVWRGVAAIRLPRRPGGHPASERGDRQGWVQGSGHPVWKQVPSCWTLASVIWSPNNLTPTGVGKEPAT